MRSRAAAVALAVASCGTNAPTYFGPPDGPIESGPMGGRVSATVTLPFRAPSAEERQRLDDQAKERSFKVPWLRRDRLALSLQYTITNLGVAAENQEAANSRIVDADVAAEVSNMVRTQILSQSAMAILAQANAAPQALLSLFR